MLTIQQAAYEVLKEAGHPLKSVEIANRILQKELVMSAAKNPIQSISQALERNIRMNKGNVPKLHFTETNYGREIAISELAIVEEPMIDVIQPEIEVDSKEMITVELPKTLMDKAKIFQLGTGLETFDEALAILIRSGLTSHSSELLETLKKEMEKL